MGYDAPMRSRVAAVTVFVAALALATAGRAVAEVDPGVLLELDRARYELRARDLRSGEEGPRLKVVLGSPSRPTPSGSYPLHRVILNPSWTPSDAARAAGARKLSPSLRGPMGVAKIPFASNGSVALHGGGDPLLLGKNVSGGCVRTADADLLRLLAWLHVRGGLREPHGQRGGEVERAIVRPARLVVR